MKKNAISRLVKDVILAAIAVLLAVYMFKSFEGGILAATALFVPGIPFGWRWASKIITAVSFHGIGIKLGISMVLGWFALPVVLISDVVRCIAAPKESAMA